MSNLIEIKKRKVRNPQENIFYFDVSIIKIENSEVTWSEVAQKYEDNSFLKSMTLQLKYDMDKMDELEFDEQEVELLKTLGRIRANKQNI
jgi:hypothetical protein